MRILFLSSVFPQPQAPTRGVYCLQLCKALAEQHDVRVIAPRSWVEALRGIVRRGRKEEAATQLKGLKVSYPWYYYPPKILRGLYGGLMWASVRRHVCRVGNEFKPDCILSYWAYPDGAAAVRAARRLNLPAAVMVGGSDVLLLAPQRRWRPKIMAVLRDADAVITVGQDLKAKLL